MDTNNTIVAARAPEVLRFDAGQPPDGWEHAQAVRFSTDWQGNNPDPELETEVRVLWSPDILYLRFVCRYRDLFVFHDAGQNWRRDHLWDRDVAEAFLQPPPQTGRNYKEFEVAPNGMWIDLDISPAGLADLQSGVQRSVHLDEDAKIWTAALAIPMQSLTPHFDPAVPWRVNFYRVEGKVEPRRYMAWQPTHTPQPNFHVPETFGNMRFEE